MKSKIINMAEKIKDPADRFLESMFQAETIADDGFSKKVVARVRRTIWIRRLALPVAMLTGAAIAVKPAIELMRLMPKFFSLIPPEISSAPAALLSQLPIVVLGGMMLTVALVFIQSLAE